MPSSPWQLVTSLMCTPVQSISPARTVSSHASSSTVLTTLSSSSRPSTRCWSKEALGSTWVHCSTTSLTSGARTVLSLTTRHWGPSSRTWASASWRRTTRCPAPTARTPPPCFSTPTTVSCSLLRSCRRNQPIRISFRRKQPIRIFTPNTNWQQHYNCHLLCIQFLRVNCVNFSEDGREWSE